MSIIEASNNSIKFSAKSNGVCMIDDVRNAFDSKDDFSRATPKNAPVFLAFVMAEKAGLKIDFDATDASLTFCISK